MAQLPNTYEEFLALSWDDKARMNMFCTRYNIEEIAKNAPLVGDEDDWHWENDNGENK